MNAKLLQSLIGFALSLSLFCAPASTAHAEILDASIESGGRERTFRIVLPDDTRPGERLPTVVALHGGLMSGKSMRKIFGLEEIAERGRFAAVYPDGVFRKWNDGRSDSDGPDDVRFMRNLADYLVRKGIADPRRLYLVGISNGGMMTYRVACEAPGIFAAYSAVIANLPAKVSEECKGGGAPFLVINSTNDSVVPWDGGDVGNFINKGEVLSTPETVEFWRRRNACAREAEVKPLPDRDARDGSTVMATQYGDCKSGAPVVLLTVEGGGHLPPGAKLGNRPFLRSVLGPANQDISAADVSWKFFKRFPLER
ncbi:MULTISPECIES: prolyl oligopeptidase family serine peptidase [Rhodomicrobium]|uniref:alpha/beta hydrolase family esterase n=1 Tax=Rhodomicrobium TaxID=1068 RepID=UPI001483B719|nr:MULTISPECIES: prolyl oligopeptidase family serine peptidase [Rhodomicrobium]